MSDDPYFQMSDNQFTGAKHRAMWHRIFSILRPEKTELLSFYDIKSLIKPDTESYRGLSTVPLDKVVGSEGRYNDFNRAFLPRKEHLRARWRSVNTAALTDVTLPPVRLFKIGDVYFVRDGNHRVSVARLRGQMDIDAEITELTTQIEVTPEMTLTDLKKKVIDFELNRVKERSGLGDCVDFEGIKFTAPGRYEEILRHILGHQSYLNRKNEQEVDLKTAARSWFLTIYLPVINIIQAEGLVKRFPDRTDADIYTWVIKHWDALGDRYGAFPKIFGVHSGKPGPGLRFKNWLKRVFSRRPL